MDTMEIGTLLAKIQADVSQLVQAQRAVDTFTKNATTSLNTVAQRFRTFGYLTTAVVTVPMTLAAKAAFNMAKEYEFSMQKIVGLAGVAQDAVNGFNKEVFALSKATGQGPKQLAEALYFINSSGVKGAQALDVLNTSAKAAAAGLGETKTVADLLTSVIAAYRTTGITAAKAADILTAAVREGKGEASGYATALGQIIPIASNLGLSFDQVAGGMAAITLTGSSTATAAVYMKGIFNALTVASDQGEQALNKLGSSYSALRVILRQKGLMPMLMEVKQLAQATGKLNDEFLSDIFPNIRGLTGFLSLTGENLKYNTALMERVTNSTGSLGRALAAVSDTIKLRYDKAIASVNVNQIRLGKTIAEVFLPILEGLARTFEKLVNWYESLGDAGKRLVLVIATIVAALGPLSLITSAIIYSISGISIAIKWVVAFTPQLVSAIKAITSSQLIWNTSLMATIGWYGLLAAAIGGIIYAVTRLVAARKQESQISEADKAYNDAKIETARNIAKEITQLDILKNAIENVNTPAEVRKNLLQEWNSKYGTLLGYMLTEQNYTEKLAEAYTTLNKKLSERITLASEMALAERLGEKRADQLQNQLVATMQMERHSKNKQDVEKQIQKVLEDAGLSSMQDFENMAPGIKKAKIQSQLSPLTKQLLEEQLYIASWKMKVDEATVALKELDVAVVQVSKRLSAAKSNQKYLFKAGIAGSPGFMLPQMEFNLKTLSYYDYLQNLIDDTTESLKGLNEEEAKGKVGDKLRTDLDRYSKAQQAILGKGKKETLKDQKQFIEAERQLNEARAKATYKTENELAYNLYLIRQQYYNRIIAAEEDAGKRQILINQKQVETIEETARQKKYEEDKYFKRKETEYELDYQNAKAYIELNVADETEKARQLEEIEIEKAQKMLWLREDVYKEDVSNEQKLLDFRKSMNTQEYRDLRDAQARKMAEYNATYAGRKALLDQELKEGKLTQKQYQEELQRLTVETFDFRKYKAEEFLTFLKSITSEELNLIIKKLEMEKAVAIATKNIKDKEAAEEALRVAKEYKQDIEAVNRQKDLADQMANVVSNSIGGALEGVGEAIGNILSGKGGIAEAMNMLLSIFGRFLVELGTAVIMFSDLMITLKEAIKSMQFEVAIPIGIAAIAAGVALQNIAKNGPQWKEMANGGLLFGPTKIVAGEYSGARQNPEVIAPLDKLKDLIVPGTGEKERLVAVVRGKDLAFVLERENQAQKRMGRAK